MDSSIWKEPSGGNKERETFSEKVLYYAELKGPEQKDLVKRSGLSKSTVSHIFNNYSSKGAAYTPSNNAVLAVSIGLGLTASEKDELFDIAFPQNKLLGEQWGKKLTIDDANDILYENKLPLLGNFKE